MKQALVKVVFKVIFLAYMLTIAVLISKLYETENVSDHREIIERGSLTNSAQLKPQTRECVDIVKQQVNKSTIMPPEVVANVIRKLLRYGPGENGTAVELGGVSLKHDILRERDRKHRFNTFISDMVSLQRAIPDMRHPLCKVKKYPDDLPPASVVLIYRDELASILLRTVYSVLQMSPPNLIKEIILVDDGSKDWDLRAAVGIHAAALEKVKVVRHETPRGLMMARQSGIMATTSDYFIVMDGHMEVSPGWLQPLLYRLQQEPKALLCSNMGQIEKSNFEFRIGFNNPKEYATFFPFFDHFNLNQMFATYSDTYKASRNGSVDPLPYGTVQGMMMVMKKDFFLHIGGFDPGMSIWGSEQIEMSVKAWMCGGRVEMVPCSVVGHMYRITPWGSVNSTHDFHSINKARMVHVWVDPPYSDVINDLLALRNFSEGNLSKRRSIRKRNKCKPYQYFVDQVRTFSDTYFPQNMVHRGQVVNKATQMCLDAATVKENEYKIIAYACHKVLHENQYFVFTDTGMIRTFNGLCLTLGQNDTVAIVSRTEGWSGKEMLWRFEVNGELVNEMTGTCMTVTEPGLVVKQCVGSDDQVWHWNSSPNTPSPRKRA